MTNEDVVLREINLAIKNMPAEDRLMIESIAMTLRNILRAHGERAVMALALVGAERAASEE